ncbi:MAG: hypothetical protein V3T39_02150 [Gammaproteobacteria bacterium]
MDDLSLHHHDPFKKTGELTFRRAAKTLKDELPNLTEEQRMVRVMQLVALIGDAHTQLEPENPEFAYWYPIRMLEFTDGYFVTSAHKSVKDLAGAQVLTVAGQPIEQVANVARSLLGAENAFDYKQRLYAIHNVALMRGLGYAQANGDLKVTLKLKSGRRVNRTLSAHRGTHPRFGENNSGFEWQFTGEMYGLPFDTYDDWFSAYKGIPASAFLEADNSRPPHLTKRYDFSSRALPESDAYYLQFNWVDDTAFVPFLRKALLEVDEMKPKRLIIDFRFNFGGDASKGADMIAEFIKRKDNPPWEELYILYGPKTFSAAVLILYLFFEHTLFTSVGEPAGGAFNMSGDPLDWRYPTTGLYLRISTLYYQKSSSDDLSSFISVDYPAPFAFADYVACKDTAVDTILSSEDVRAITQVALKEGGAAARKAYATRKEKFKNLSWWQPPTEIELRKTCDLLQEQGRMDEALETCKLNSEINPTIWNVWYNLGAIQRKMGLDEAFSSYRCVTEIEPHNWNVASIKDLFERMDVDPDLPAGCPVEN